MNPWLYVVKLSYSGFPNYVLWFAQKETSDQPLFDQPLPDKSSSGKLTLDELVVDTVGNIPPGLHIEYVHNSLIGALEESGLLYLGEAFDINDPLTGDSIIKVPRGFDIPQIVRATKAKPREYYYRDEKYVTHWHIHYTPRRIRVTKKWATYAKEAIDHFRKRGFSSVTS